MYTSKAELLYKIANEDRDKIKKVFISKDKYADFEKFEDNARRNMVIKYDKLVYNGSEVGKRFTFFVCSGDNLIPLYSCDTSNRYLGLKIIERLSPCVGKSALWMELVDESLVSPKERKGYMIEINLYEEFNAVYRLATNASMNFRLFFRGSWGKLAYDLRTTLDDKYPVEDFYENIGDMGLVARGFYANNDIMWSGEYPKEYISGVLRQSIDYIIEEYKIKNPNVDYSWKEFGKRDLIFFIIPKIKKLPID